jgi:hypothetical protein
MSLEQRCSSKTLFARGSLDRAVIPKVQGKAFSSLDSGFHNKDFGLKTRAWFWRISSRSVTTGDDPEKTPRLTILLLDPLSYIGA